MLYVDIPSRGELAALVRVRSDLCLSLYLPTTPLSQAAQADRIALANQLADALRQAEAASIDKRRVAAVEAQVRLLLEDRAFWAVQAHALAVLATPERVWTFRLPNRLQPVTEVADRFYVKPLFRTLAFPHEAFVLALAQGSARLFEITRDLPPLEVKVADLPRNAASAVRRASLADRLPKRRIQGSEGRKVRLTQYARMVDEALRPLLAAREVPLLLASAPPLDAIFRSICTLPNLAPETIEGSPETLSPTELDRAARALLDRLYAAELAGLRTLFAERERQGRTTTDIATAARAATWGAIETLLVDIDRLIPGRVDEETGAVQLADAASAESYGVIDEIAGRAFLTGARVLGVRAADLPHEAPLAAILRHPLAG